MLEAVSEPDLPQKAAPTPGAGEGASRRLQASAQAAPAGVYWASLCPELDKAVPGGQELELQLACSVPPDTHTLLRLFFHADPPHLYRARLGTVWATTGTFWKLLSLTPRVWKTPVQNV